MGLVYLATDPLLQRTVAIKVLPEQDEDLRDRFAREARSAAALRHSNVVTIYDIGEHEGQPFIAMEFLDGESLSEIVRRRAPLSVDRRLQLMLELCAGLGYAHARGIVHRDIKPGNLIVTGDGALKILDFGLARIVSEAGASGLTRVGSVMGTPHYMSPEQVDGKVADSRSDIFSVGVVFYELLTYQKAYPGESAHVVLHNIVHVMPTPIRQLMPSIDPDLETIVNKALEKDPAQRYQDLAALAADAARVRAKMMAGAQSDTMIGPPPGVAERRQRPREAASLNAIAQRRTAQIEAFLLVATTHLTEGRLQEAVEACENALLLDSHHAHALQLLAQAQASLEEGQFQEYLQAARAHLSAGELSQADAVIEQSLKLSADAPEALALRQDVKEQRRERERAVARAESTRAAIARGRQWFDEGAFEAAQRSANQALAYDADNAEALSLRDRATEAINTQQQHKDEERACSSTEPPREETPPPPSRKDSGTVRASDQETVRMSRDAILKMVAAAQSKQPASAPSAPVSPPPPHGGRGCCRRHRRSHRRRHRSLHRHHQRRCRRHCRRRSHNRLGRILLHRPCRSGASRAAASIRCGWQAARFCWC